MSLALKHAYSWCSITNVNTKGVKIAAILVAYMFVCRFCHNHSLYSKLTISYTFTKFGFH